MYEETEGQRRKEVVQVVVEAGSLVHILKSPLFTQWEKSEGGGRWRSVGFAGVLLCQLEGGVLQLAFVFYISVVSVF